VLVQAVVDGGLVDCNELAVLVVETLQQRARLACWRALIG